MNTDTLTSGSTGQKPHLTKNCIRIQCNTENLRQERGDPYSSETSEELLNEPTKNPKPNKNDSHEQVRGDPY